MFIELQCTQEHMEVGGPGAEANHLWSSTAFLAAEGLPVAFLKDLNSGEQIHSLTLMLSLCLLPNLGK